jgi:hypothetical protein
MRRLTSVMLVAAAVFGSSSAWAQRFGEAGDVVFAGERLMGIQGTHVYEEELAPNEPDYENDFTTISFGWRGPVSPDGFSPFDVPRLGFDVFVIDHLSIGGSLGWASSSYDNDPPGGGAPFGNEADGYSAFTIQPRVGYAYMFSDVFGIWPRGGIGYHSFNIDNWQDENGWSLGVECMFPIAPVPHFGFLVGPSFDIDLTGTRDRVGELERDRTYRSFGLQIGIFGWI